MRNYLFCENLFHSKLFIPWTTHFCFLVAANILIHPRVIHICTKLDGFPYFINYVQTKTQSGNRKPVKSTGKRWQRNLLIHKRNSLPWGHIVELNIEAVYKPSLVAFVQVMQSTPTWPASCKLIKLDFRSRPNILRFIWIRYHLVSIPKFRFLSLLNQLINKLASKKSSEWVCLYYYFT